MSSIIFIISIIKQQNKHLFRNIRIYSPILLTKESIKTITLPNSHKLKKWFKQSIYHFYLFLYKQQSCNETTKF